MFELQALKPSAVNLGSTWGQPGVNLGSTCTGLPFTGSIISDHVAVEAPGLVLSCSVKSPMLHRLETSKDVCIRLAEPSVRALYSSVFFSTNVYALSLKPLELSHFSHLEIV